MLSGGKEAMMRRILGDSEVVDALARIIAGLEHELLTEVAALEDALGVDHLEDVPTQEQRQEQLTALVEAKLAGDPEQFYREHILPNLVENADEAAAYLDFSQEEWEQQLERWGQAYREGGGTGTDRDLADEHVRRQYGVTLEEFERFVVDYDEEVMVEQALARPIRSGIEGVRMCRREAGDEE